MILLWIVKGGFEDSMDNIFQLFSLSLVFKGLILILIALFLIFILQGYVQVRALDRMVKISSGKESALVQILATLYVVLIASLFLLALAIL
jgi:membrane-bound metal-dependent hydrolase YbcI (DUF457 family)